MHNLLYLQNKAELSQLPPFFLPAAGGIDAGRFDAAVSENVGKPHDVLELRVVRPGEQVAELINAAIIPEHILNKK